MSRLFLLLALALALSPLPCQAQTNSPSSGNRYLLIYETSAAMQRRSQGSLDAVRQMLSSGLGGQLKRGDTLGVWTYGDQLHAGRFPLQHWSPEAQNEITKHVLGFLQSQPHGKQGRLETVFPMLDRLIKDRTLLTVILVSAAEQKIHGTPFDAPINERYTFWEKEQQQAHMPFITVLRGRAGLFTAFTITAAPWPVDMPPVPPDLPVARTSPNKTVNSPAAPKATPPVAPNLIVSGRKPAPLLPQATAPPTNSPPADATTKPVPAPLPSDPGTNPTIDSKQPPVPSQLPSPVPVKSEIAPVDSSTKLAQFSPPQLAPSPTDIRAAPANSSPSPGESTGTKSAARTAPQLIELKQGLASPDQSTPNSSASPSAAPATARTREGSPPRAATMIEPNHQGLGKTKSEKSDLKAKSSNSTIAVVPQHSLDRNTPWLLTGAIVALTFVGIWLWARQVRSNRRVSLITRSLEQQKP